MAKSKRNPKLRVIAGGAAAPKAVVTAPARRVPKTGPVSIAPRSREPEPENENDDEPLADEDERPSTLATPERGIPRAAIFAGLVIIVGIAAYLLTRSAHRAAPTPPTLAPAASTS